METIQIILIAAVFAVVGVRLYQKYVKKDQGKPSSGRTADSGLSYSAKDDDYEPYSKK